VGRRRPSALPTRTFAASGWSRQFPKSRFRAFCVCRPSVHQNFCLPFAGSDRVWANTNLRRTLGTRRPRPVWLLHAARMIGAFSQLPICSPEPLGLNDQIRHVRCEFAILCRCLLSFTLRLPPRVSTSHTWRLAPGCALDRRGQLAGRHEAGGVSMPRIGTPKCVSKPRCLTSKLRRVTTRFGIFAS
jgi:hypothetical protein